MHVEMDQAGHRPRRRWPLIVAGRGLRPHAATGRRSTSPRSSAGRWTVTIDEEGIARIRDVFRVSAPVAGRVERLPVEVGDKVYRDTTAVAVDPSGRPALPRRPLAPRTRGRGRGGARRPSTLAEAQVAAPRPTQRLTQRRPRPRRAPGRGRHHLGARLREGGRRSRHRQGAGRGRPRPRSSFAEASWRAPRRG